jgi:predicted nuclease of predicted toxin-antitoxin system
VSKLFIERYLDEDVDVLVAELLSKRGYSVTTARDAGTLGHEDREQLAYAVRSQRALLTHNRVDFERLALVYFERGEVHFGIILAVRRTPHDLVNRLLPLLNGVTAEEFQNQVQYL